MNIQRFKWPVIVAAGLHGALFLSLPDTSVGILTPPKPPVQIFPPNPPKEEPMEMNSADAELSVDRVLAGGGRVLPELPEVPHPLPDGDVFRVEMKTTFPAGTGIRDLSGYDGRPAGAGQAWDGLPTAPVFSPEMLDQTPRATVQMAPDYPPKLRQEERIGSVTVEFVVNPAGRVVRAEAIRATHRDFVEPAVRAVLKWRFEPGKRHGKAVPFRMAVPIEFNIERN